MMALQLLGLATAASAGTAASAAAAGASAPPRPFEGGGAGTNGSTTFVAAQALDFAVLSGGASVVEGTDAHHPALRSGNPGHETIAAIRAPLRPGAEVTRVALSYKYNTGFGPSGVGTNFTVRVAGQPVYISPHLTDYTYTHNHTNYSKPVAVDVAVSIAVPPASSPTRAPARIEFEFANNKRNVQLLLPIAVTLECSGGCAPPPPPPQSHSLRFGPPSIVTGPVVRFMHTTNVD